MKKSNLSYTLSITQKRVPGPIFAAVRYGNTPKKGRSGDESLATLRQLWAVRESNRRLRTDSKVPVLIDRYDCDFISYVAKQRPLIQSCSNEYVTLKKLKSMN